MENIPVINPANTKYSIIKACTLVIDRKVGVLLDHGVSLCFVSPATYQTLVPKSCTEAIMHILKIVTYAAVEKGMKHKGEQR